MEAIKQHKGLVYPMNRVNVDTDQIIPKQFLKRIERTGFGQFLIYHWRFDDDGNKRSNFSLNDPKYDDASILIAGDNFGCGSSREHAPWSLLEDRKSTRLNSSHVASSYAVCCLKKRRERTVAGAWTGQTKRR